MKLKHAWLKAIQEEGGPRPVLRHIALVLASFMDADGGKCYPGQRMIAERTGLSQKAVSQAIPELEELGWIHRERKSANPASPTVYTPRIPPNVTTLVRHDATTESSHVSKVHVTTLVPPRDYPGSSRVTTEGSRSSSVVSSEIPSTKADNAREDAAEGIGITDSQLRHVALEQLGLARLTKATDTIRVSREIQELLHTIDRRNLLAAIQGLAMLRDEGQCGLEPGRPYTPGILLSWRKPVWYGQGDSRTERNLLDAAQEHYRRSLDLELTGTLGVQLRSI